MREFSMSQYASKENLYEDKYKYTLKLLNKCFDMIDFQDEDDLCDEVTDFLSDNAKDLPTYNKST